MANSVVFCSDYYKTHKVFGDLKNACTIINGASVTIPEIDVTLPGENKIKLMFASRVSHHKGYELLFEALPDDVDLIVMNNQQANMELKKNIHCIGYKNGHERFAYMKVANAVIVPSTLEPFGLVCLEALLVKTPLIASYVDGMNHWLHPDAAFNCGTTIESIKAAISEFRADQKKHVDFGFNYAQNFSEAMMCEQYRKLFNAQPVANENIIMEK